jgi:hypothetical protein
MRNPQPWILPMKRIREVTRLDKINQRAAAH